MTERVRAQRRQLEVRAGRREEAKRGGIWRRCGRGRLAWGGRDS
jgi:hypothetical protein